jgi:succinate dehydrogenase / fumarate reductase cytochrome b subunit
MSFPFRRVFSSSVGTKLLIGLTGLALFVYMVLHLAGNAIVFLGREPFNEYSHFLISNPLIVPIEVGLLLVFVLHIYKSGTNWVKNQAARPAKYVQKAWAGGTSRKSIASSTMILSGIVVGLFVLIHVKQFRFGTFYEVPENPAVRDLYSTEVEIFREPGWVLLYVVATLLVGLHIRHGVASAFQSLGFDHPRYTRRLTAISIAMGVLIGVGLAIIPVWVYFTH